MNLLQRVARLLAWLCALFLAGLPHIAQAQMADVTAEQVKAAYLYKFLAYIDWPPTMAPPPGAPYVIGVQSADRVYDELARLVSNRPVQGHPVQVRRIAGARDAQPPMHVVFVGPALGPELPQALALWGDAPVVTVADQPTGLAAGAMLNFVEADGRVRFEADAAVAERAGVKLSARLLAVATRVLGVRR